MGAMTRPALAISEASWQQQVIDLAHAYRWQHLHVRRSVGKGRRWVTATNVAGWPDLLLWHEGQHRVIAAELKSQHGQPTGEQLAVLASLARAGIEAHVWRPSDLDAAHAALRPPSVRPADQAAHARTHAMAPVRSGR